MLIKNTATFAKKHLKKLMTKIIRQLEIIVIVNLNVEELHIAFRIPKETLAVFHNGLNYCYHFIIKELEMGLKSNLSVNEKIQKNS